MSTETTVEAQAAMPPLRSVHTTSFPALLEQLGISVLVTTYQAGKLVMLRSDQGVLNTHFRDFPRPMGLAVTPERVALGTATDIREFHDVPAAARKLEPADRHDACYLPRTTHATGDVQIHEMAWVRARGQKSEARGRRSEVRKGMRSCGSSTRAFLPSALGMTAIALCRAGGRPSLALWRRRTAVI